MDTNTMPLPGVSFNKLASQNAVGPFIDVVSGEITANVMGKPIGAPQLGGRVANVWLSIAASGKDDTNALKVQVDVKKNGTSVLSTQPYISHVSGEASQQKTTKITGDTGIVQSVMDSDENVCVAGDVLTYDFVLTRTASPTTEMSNAVITVEFEPI